MDTILELFGSGKDLTVVQMSCRGVLIFIISLVLLRVSGRRSFGLKTPIDLVISILLGSLLSRAVVGASPFIPVVVCSLVIVLLHRVFSWLSICSEGFRDLTEGKKILLFKNGIFLEDNLKKALVSKEDILHKVRKQIFQDDTENIDKIWMERNGDVSVVKSRKN